MAFEIAFLLFLAVVIIAALVTMAKPISEVFAERMKFKLQDMGSETEKQLRDKINILDGELLAVKQQVNSMQETVEFLAKEVESQQGTVKLKSAEKQDR